MADKLNDEQTMHAMSIDDMYKVCRVLAQGVAGVTELVTIEGAGPFVRKKMSKDLANRAVWSAMALCDCDRLPTVEATYELPEQFVVVYDFVPGETLESYVETNGRLDRDEAVSLIEDVCEAAAALHVLGVVHRDISPKNIIVSGDGAHLIDLGIARMRVEGASRDTTSLGTWGYASPEQYGFTQTDARSDVYSLGRVLGYMLTGSRPDSEAYQSLLHDDAVVDGRMRSSIERACAFEPSRRFQSVADFRAALVDEAGSRCCDESASSKQPPIPTAPTASGDGGASKAAGTRRASLLLLAAVLVIALALMAIRLAANRAGTDLSSTSPDADGAALTATQRDAPSGTTASGSAASQAQDVRIVDSGWSVDQNGIFIGTCGLANDSSDMAVDYPDVWVTGRDASGSVVFTQEQTLYTVLPGQTAYLWITADTNGEALASVDFESVNSAAEKTRSLAIVPSIEVKDVSARSDSFGGLVVSGDILADPKEVAAAAALGSSGDLAVTVVLRDESGTPVYAWADYVTPAEGGETSFSLSLYGAPDYATYDVNVQIW